MRRVRSPLIFISCLIFWLGACSGESSRSPDVPAERSSTGHEKATPPASVKATEYSLSVDPELSRGGNVRLEIHTNIPGIIEVKAGVSLHGQADDDVWIGTNRRARLSDGAGTVMLFTSELPKGKYDAEVSFYPRWGFHDATSRATGISKELHAFSSITFVGSGESAADVQFKENGQRWVMANVGKGDPWRPRDWIQRFGKYQELRVNVGNPELVKAYYFSRIDITLIVNAWMKVITNWHFGRAYS